MLQMQCIQLKNTKQDHVFLLNNVLDAIHYIINTT